MGDTDDSGKGRHFKSRFIQPGVAGYPGQFGNVLITKESLDRFINTIVGVPVIINHKDLTEKNADDERVGVVNSVWFDEKDGWYWCDGVIWDKTAQNLITDKNWSVSCSYDVKTANDEGGSENNIKYDMEFLDGVFTHLALVSNPRYERANIVFNSKTEILNFNPNHGEDGKFCRGNYSEYLNIIQTDKFKQLDDNLKSAIEFIYCTEPVKTLSGKEFQKDGIKLTDKVPEYYAEYYPNGVNNPILGNVKLDKEGVKDSLGHGIGSLKAAAYAAVPDVIEKGYLYDKQINWKDRGYDSAVIVAPIKIENDDYVCEVVVKTGSKRQGFYLHEVEITNKLADVFKTANGSTSTSSNLIITDKIQKFNPNVKENEEMNVENWNEQDHPRDEQGRFTEKESGKTYTEETYDEFHKRFYKENEDKWRFKTIIGGYTVSRTLDGKWGYSQIKPEDIDKYLTGDTIRVSLANRPEMRKDEEGTYDWYEDDKKLKDFQNKGFEVSDKYNDGYYTNYILKKNKANNDKETEMALLEELKKLITKVENDKGDDMDDKEKIENEKVDKRKLIDEVGGILKGKVDDEIIRTIIGKLEKVAYDESEAGKADNEKDKEDVENCGKKKVKNSKEDFFSKLNEIYNATAKPQVKTSYVSRADREQAAVDYFAK